LKLLPNEERVLKKYKELLTFTPYLRVAEQLKMPSAVVADISRRLHLVGYLDFEIIEFRPCYKPKIYRIKIRLYNEEITPESPEGQFQGFYTIDGQIDPVTGLPDIEFWVFKLETTICKYHLWLVFNHPYTWMPVELTEFAYRREIRPAGGIQDWMRVKKVEESIGKYVARFIKEKVKPDIVALFEKYKPFTVEEMILGESDIPPRYVPRPEGIICEQFLINKGEMIIWHSGKIDEPVDPFETLRFAAIWIPIAKEEIERIKKALEEIREAM